MKCQESLESRYLLYCVFRIKRKKIDVSKEVKKCFTQFRFMSSILHNDIKIASKVAKRITCLLLMEPFAADKKRGERRVYDTFNVAIAPGRLNSKAMVSSQSRRRNTLITSQVGWSSLFLASNP